MWCVFPNPRMIERQKGQARQTSAASRVGGDDLDAQEQRFPHPPHLYLYRWLTRLFITPASFDPPGASSWSDPACSDRVWPRPHRSIRFWSFLPIFAHRQSSLLHSDLKRKGKPIYYFWLFFPPLQLCALCTVS